MIKNDLKSVIFKVRGEFVIFDKDIARLYGVTTGALNQAVKRNRNRFPQDFMFQLHQEEYECLKSQIVIAKGGRGGSRVMPNVFTEHGVLMLASMLRSEVAAIVSINIARTFAEMRRQITSMAEFSADIAFLKSKMELLERCVDENVERLALRQAETKKRKKGKEKEKPASRVLTEPPDFDTFAADIPLYGKICM